MRLRPVRNSLLRFVLCMLTLSACSDDSGVGPPPPNGQKPPVWSEITDLIPSVTLYGMWAESENNIFAVGRGGEIWQWNGTQWTRLPNSDGHDLFAIDGNAGSVVAVGDQGTLLKRVNGAFVKNDTGLFNGLHDVWASASGDFFIAGDDGLVMRLSGTSPPENTNPVPTALLSIWGASDTDIFATGLDGVILHNDGASWTNMTSPTTELLAAVDGTSASDVYAVGGRGTVIHYDGNNWSPVESHTTDLLQACCAACGPGAAGANGSVLTWTGGNVHVDELSGAPWLYALAHATNDTWVVGMHTILRHDGTAWSPETRGTVPAMRAMTSSPSLGLVTVGDNGSVMLGEPSKWQAEDAGALQRLNTVWTSPAGDIFAAGTNRIYRRDSTGWVMESDDIAEYYDIGGNSAHIFAVGKNGIVREREGTGWKVIYPAGSGVVFDLHAISMTGGGGYIAGVGRILYYEVHAPQQDGTWVVRYTKDSYNFWDILVTETSKYTAIAVGADGLSMGRPRNDNWEVMLVPVTGTLYSVTLGPGGDVYAAGTGGALLRLVHDVWKVIPAPTTRTFFSVRADGGALFVCGGDDASGGFLLRYGPPSH